MSKKDDIANDLSRGRRNIKKALPDTKKAETVVKKVHNESGETIRTTLDLPKYIHKALKVATAQKEMTLKDYLVSLVKKDLNLK